MLDCKCERGASPLSGRCYPPCPGRRTWLSSWLTWQRGRRQCSREAFPSSAVDRTLCERVEMQERWRRSRRYLHRFHASHTSRCPSPTQSISKWEEIKLKSIFNHSITSFLSSVLHSHNSKNANKQKSMQRLFPSEPITHDCHLTFTTAVK